MKQKLFVANWKMQFSFNQSCAFVQTHYEQLNELAQHNSIILCPSFPALHTIAMLCSNSAIKIGAQNVSRHACGAYTGEVSAQSLAEAGCSHCIIGHAEVKQLAHETNIDIEHKLKELLKQTIIPIICIGENKEQHEQKQTYAVLEKQLTGLLHIIAHNHQTVTSYVIAYEPIWAVGGNETPSIKIITEIINWIAQRCAAASSLPFSLLYGGSVNVDNAQELLAIPSLNGLLLGRASLDMDTLKAIVQS